MNKPLLDELLQLPPDERRELAEALLDSLDETDLPPLTDEQIAELNRRMAEHERDPSSAVPWEEVVASLRARFG